MKPHPWSPPPNLPKPGDALKSTLFRQVGAALTQWEEFEFWCSVLYLNLIPKVDSNLDYQRLLEYDAKLGFHGRAEFLQEVYAKTLCDQGRENAFADFINEARMFSERRNDITHGVARLVDAKLERQEDKGLRLVEFSSGWYLVPLSNLQRRLGPDATKPYFAYTALEIRYYRMQFAQLTERLRSVFLRPFLDPNEQTP